jgi:hypothetical protein
MADKAVALYGKDPVSACFMFQLLLAEEFYRTTENPSQYAPPASARLWLQQATKIAVPAAMSVLDRDFREAVVAQDIRGAFLALVMKARLHNTQDTDIGSLLKRLIEETTTKPDGSKAVWELKDVSAKRVGESVGHRTGLIKVQALKGGELVRVTAKVRNVSDRSDPSYVHFVPEVTQERIFWMLEVERPKQDDHYRLLNPDFAFLVLSGTHCVQCAYVEESCGALCGHVTVVAQTRILYSGSYLKQGETADLNCVFAVPRGTKLGAFILLGSPVINLSFD